MNARRPPLLEVKDLTTTINTEKGPVNAVDGISLGIGANETLGLVGESGSGKTMTALSIMRLIPEPPAKITRGEIIFNGEDLLSKTRDEMRRIRGRDISMIFQEPQTSLNPVFKVGDQISEALRAHYGTSGKEARERAVEMLHRVRIPEPEQRYDSYPYELSGGMQQRVMIAMALICNAKLLIADEPTTALDVTVQKQILELIAEIKQEFGISVLFITHDLSILRIVADRVAVMYSGKIVEAGSVEEIYCSPKHPYTQKLFDSVRVLAGVRLRPPLKKGTGTIYYETIRRPGKKTDISRPDPGLGSL